MKKSTFQVAGMSCGSCIISEGQSFGGRGGRDVR